MLFIIVKFNINTLVPPLAILNFAQLLYQCRSSNMIALKHAKFMNLCSNYP